MVYPAPMRFEPDDLALLDATEEIEIETAVPGGPAHRTIIWVVVDAGEAFIRSVNGTTARWYREAVADPSVTIHVDGRSLPARARPATDPDAVARTSAALEGKYAGSPSMASMVVTDILDATMRLTPA